MTFAPTDEREQNLLRYFRNRYGRISVERLLCGQGLLDLYAAHCSLKGAHPRYQAPAEVTEAARRDDPVARDTLLRFLKILGDVSGDAALTIGARGGVYLCGGILPRLLDWLPDSRFLEAFAAKGRMSDYTADIPVHVVTAPWTGLLAPPRPCIIQRSNDPRGGRMIPETLRALLDATQGQRRAEWAGREVWLANEAWGELAVSLQGAQVLHYQPCAPEATQAHATTSSPDQREDAWCPAAGCGSPQRLRSDPARSAAAFRCAGPGSPTNTPPTSPPTARDPCTAPHARPTGASTPWTSTRKAWSCTSAARTPAQPTHASCSDPANAQRLHVELITEHTGETPVKITGACTAIWR